MKVSNFIFDCIKSETIKNRGFNCWISRANIIQDLINQLQPDKPEDQTNGFLAYNVPNKDRMKMKTGRFLTRKLKLNNGFLPDKSISNIAENINSELFSDNIDIQLVSGEKITKNYHNEIGSSSCMTGSYADYTRLYEMNPGKIQMLTMYYMNNSARAIVYKLDCGKYYMDRIYFDCDMLLEKMKDYAWKNNWYFYNRLSSLTHEEKRELVVSGLDYEDGYIPYMDTFRGNLINGRLQLCYLNYDIELQNTDGSLESGCCCESCNEHVSEDDVVCINDEFYCNYCANEYFTCCDYCGEWINRDNVIHIEDKDEWYCDYCADRQTICCEDCGEYNKHDYICIENERYVCLSCIENYAYCEDCREYFIDNRCIDENGFCEDCRPEEEEEEKQCTISHRSLHLAESYPGQIEFNYEE